MRAAGVDTAFVECYRGDGHGDLGRMMYQAKTFGWPHAIPIVGLYGGDRLRDYALSSYGESWGFWRVEQIDPSDW